MNVREEIKPIRDLFVKIRILLFMFICQFDVWKTEVWSKDLDNNFCCDGRKCGCGGASVEDMFLNG